jgi:hypothetical protein
MRFDPIVDSNYLRACFASMWTINRGGGGVLRFLVIVDRTVVLIVRI